MAVAALVLGIVSLVCFGPLAGILAVIFGFLGLQKAKQGGSGRGMSIAGIILGIIGSVAWIGIGIAVIATGDSVSDTLDDAYGEADSSDYDISPESCEIDEFGGVTFEGTIENTAGRDMSFTINTEIRESGSGPLLDSPSTFVDIREGDTARWSVYASVPDGSDVECEIQSVDNFGNFD
jgi:hypothetical protein